MDNNFNNYISKIIENKFKTVFIAAIAAIEDEFGEDFGLFKDDNEPLTDYENKMYDKFELVRKRIMDVGNKESRDVSELLNNCNIELVKGYILIKVKGNKNGNV